MSYTREDWLLALLSAAGNTAPSDYVKRWILAWTQLETGPYSAQTPGAAFNLLNTEEQWKADGTAFVTTDFNSAGVKNYASFADGIAANAKVLQNGRYPHLLQAVRENSEAALTGPTPEISADIDLWGTRHAASISQLASNTQGLRPGEQFPGIGNDLPPQPVHSPSAGELPGYPFKNERTEPDINHDLDCVPDSLASMLQYVTGKTFSGADLKFAVYGEAYVGGTSASAFVDYARAHGGHLFALEGDGSTLVKDVRTQLLAGHPTLATEPNPYGNPQFSHVIAFYKWDATTLTVMDPFGAHQVTHSDAEWAALFLFHEVWTMERMGAMIPQDWKDDGTTLTAKNNIAVVKGFRALVLDAPVWDADNVPQIVEYHTDSVLYHRPDLGGGQIQPFRDDLLWYTAAKGVVREQELGLEIFLRDQKIADLEKQLDIAGGTAPPTPPDTSALKADLDNALAAIQQAEIDLKLIK